MSDTALQLPQLAATSRVPPAARARGYWRTVGRRLGRDYVTLFFALVIAIIALAALLAPLVAPFDPNASSIANRLKPIGYRGFILGTDELGRDVLSRLIFGARISLLMGLLPVGLATCIGGFLGLLAGFAGGWINGLVMRIMDVFYAFPSVLLAVAISGTMGGGIGVSLVALTLVFIRRSAACSKRRRPRFVVATLSTPRGRAARQACPLFSIMSCATCLRPSSSTLRASSRCRFCWPPGCPFLAWASSRPRPIGD